ncbi:hypothetical protein IQ07DRAFT_646338 [Pyrenochaeta sp. DS3sAY3a]|nr:hypothetical protein IQ07DRAFT_646338 [Pyrenochaeta sp. DS3sAY3a]
MSKQSSKSWAPPSYPPTTVENDGTLCNRYDVRETLAYVTEDLNNVNNVFMLYYITTKEGKKYHLTTNAGMRGSQKLGSFMSLNDLTEKKSRGSSMLISGDASPQTLSMKSDAQSIISPTDGDKWTGTRHYVEASGVKLKTTLRPTGGNFYYGGMGGVQLMRRGPDPDFSTAIPGWSWYWANPTTRVTGTITVDGIEQEIDTEKSFSLFERQWGNFQCGKGYVALWFFLESGEVVISWCMEPDAEGVSRISFASIWSPNGLHQTLPVGPNSKFTGVHISVETGLQYFTKFFLDLPAIDSNFTFEKWFKDGELEPIPEQKGRYITIMESYGEGTGRYNGKDITFHGHVEQLQLEKIVW